MVAPTADMFIEVSINMWIPLTTSNDESAHYEHSTRELSTDLSGTFRDQLPVLTSLLTACTSYISRG